MKNIYTVGQVNSYIKNMFAQDYMLRSIVVSGELSNVKYHSSGHIYFTMKDKSGAISCVMFAGNTRSLSFRLEEGLSVEATGSVNVYERDGKYQLYATAIKKAGAGALYERYEALKAELAEMGMFDESYKQPIPKYAMRVGVVTASTGAAVQDIMQITARRNPYVQLFLYPAQVQGEGAKESIVAGINSLDNFGVDVIIVGRGGGSIEDLWAFNERCVADAIFNCRTPIISAVGHESDTTIADYVADLRAPTPSAAAELAVFSYEDYEKELVLLRSSLEHYMHLKLDRCRKSVTAYSRQINALSPYARIREKRLILLNMIDALDTRMDGKIMSARHSLNVAIERLKGANPIEKLEKGYAYVEDANGKSVKDVSKLKVGDSLKLHLVNGSIDTKVVNITRSTL